MARRTPADHQDLPIIPDLEMTCPLCFGPATAAQSGNAKFYSCERCWAFLLDDSFAAARLTDLSPTEKAILSIQARRRSKHPERHILPIHFGNFEALIETYIAPDLATRFSMVLEYFAKQSNDVGSAVERPDTYPAFECTSVQSLHWVIDALVESQLLQWVPEIGQERPRLIVTPKGWIEIGSTNAIAGTCFIAMSFNTEMDTAHQVIERVIRDLKLRPLRVDKVEHNKNINDFIMAEIRKSEVVIAEFTGQRAGVYFEAGFALGLGREVVYVCRDDDFKNTHFDTNSYSHVIWADLQELETKLRARLLNTVPSLIHRAKAQ
jgi:nucleoside 2-deoxyribosyltransferase